MAEIKYKISGKSDTTAIAKTQLAMKKLGSEVVNLNKIVGGLAIAKVMQVVSKVTNGATENFLAQNKALAQYNATVAKFGKSLSNLNKIQNEVSRNNFFDGDSINNATKMAVAMGLTEKQIEDVLKASTDLAASGVMPLDQAVKELSLSYSGNIEQLKRMNPELANLTKEQLAQGEAVRIIGQEYKGMADAMANTFEGRDTQWKNSFSDLQAEVGEIIQKVKYFGQGKWLDPINRLSNWLNNNSSKIAAFIVTLPENFKIAAVAIKDTVKELFSIDFWAKNGEVIVEIFKETFIAAKEVATAIMVALMKSLAELVKVVAVNMGKSLVSGLFGNLGSFGIEALYRANVIDYDTRANLLNKLDDKVSSLDNTIESWQKENKVTLEGALNNVKSSWKDVGKTISDNIKSTHKTLSGLSEEIDSSFGDIVSKATRDINDNVTENISNVEPSETMTNPTTFVIENKDNNNNNNIQQQQQSVWAKWKLNIENLFNTLFPKMADKIENFSANVIGKILEDKINILKSADIYDGVDHKGEIEALSNIRDVLIDFAKGNLFIKDENGKFVRGEKSSFTRTLDVALGSMAVSKYNKKHNTNIPVLQPLTGFIASLIKVLDLEIFDKITKVFINDETKRMEIYKAIKDFTKSTREVFNKLSADLFKIVGNTLIKSSGQIGNYINAGMQGASNGGGFYGALFAVIAQLLSDIMKVVSENSEKFQAFQNFVTLILESLISEILPIFDEFVTPFLEGFTAVKEILSGVVYLLGSIIGIFTEVFREFTRELNITASTVSGIFKFIGGIFQVIKGFVQFLQPVMNALSYVTKIIATAVYAVEWVIVNGINAIIWALNQLPWVNIDSISGYGTEDWDKTMSDIWNGGGNTDEDNAYLNAALSQSASNTTGASASYTAARDIYVTINYDHSYVNGDAREIAINLYNELKDCKKLNLIA